MSIVVQKSPLLPHASVTLNCTVHSVGTSTAGAVKLVVVAFDEKMPFKSDVHSVVAMVDVEGGMDTCSVMVCPELTVLGIETGTMIGLVPVPDLSRKLA